MIPSKEEILSQLVLLWGLRNEVEPVEAITMGALAKELMYPALFLIEALEYGKSLGVLEHDYKSDKLSVVGEYEGTYMGEEIDRVMGCLEELVSVHNEREEDLSLGLIQTWCMGIRPSACELALRRLVLDGTLAEYRLTDPKDTKSSYDFYTLAENKDKQWGKKQFKEFKK
jgi:hypothetical protein